VGYLLHGYPQDERHWIELGVIESYEQLLSAGQVDPMIWIIPYQPEPYFTQSDGGPGSLEEVLLQDLLSAVNTKYRISTTPGDHAILGVSRGGVWALEIGMRHPDQFEIIAALSPALAFNHPRRAYDPFEIVRSADELPEHILISSGDREPRFSGEIDRFVQVLEEVQVMYLHLQHEGQHEDAAWEGIMNQVLLFVGEAIRENRTHVLD
jgi:enterochelin esterase-like enzyme